MTSSVLLLPRMFFLTELLQEARFLWYNKKEFKRFALAPRGKCMIFEQEIAHKKRAISYVIKIT